PGARQLHHRGRDDDRAVPEPGDHGPAVPGGARGHQVPGAGNPAAAAGRAGMKIDVFFSPVAVTAPDTAGRTVVVIDVLRATTSIAVALANGAKAVVPAASSEEALRLAQNLERDDVVLAGERKSQRVPGFALGNSPADFTKDVVQGKTVVMATTNGTPAFLCVQNAREVIAGAAVNFSVSVARCRAALEQHGELAILCAGRERHFALE